MPFSTSSPLTTILNMKVKKALHQDFLELLSSLLKSGQMANIINKARTKQRSLVFTLLVLKKAFGEVRHNLIQTALDYHHIPYHIKSLVKSLYNNTDFKTSILTNEFRTPFVSVGRGVLQGDCLSPLTFKLCFNTFLQHIKSEKYHQFGFSLKFSHPLPVRWRCRRHKAARKNQLLINRFIIWCDWSKTIITIIRVDKIMFYFWNTETVH